MWVPKPARIRMTGFPLALTLMGVAWWYGSFPSSVYHHVAPPQGVVWRLLCMIVLVDALQTLLHKASHTVLKGSVLGKSHMVHHLARDPVPYDAFATGVLDAIFQLIGPIFLAVFVLHPDRTTLTLFGALYSWWLQFLHSPPKPWHKNLRAFGLVTPEDHRRHHTNPNVEFSNVFHISSRAA